MTSNYSLINVEPYEDKTYDDNQLLTLSDLFTSKFTHVIKSDTYRPFQDTLYVYDVVRKMFVDKTEELKLPIVTLSPDTAISGSTITGVAEKFMMSDGQEKPSYSSDLKVIYIDSLPDMSTSKYDTYGDYVNSVLADTLGLTYSTYTLRRINLTPKNVYMIGIDDKIMPDNQNDMISSIGLNLFTLQNLRKKGIARIIKYIAEQCKYDNVHVVIDMSVINSKYAPSVYRDNNSKDGLDLDELLTVCNELKKIERLHSIDITGYNFGKKIDKDKHYVANMLTVSTIEKIVSVFIELPKKTINLFNEETQFLIWKRLDDKDHGWMILRGMNTQEKIDMIKGIGEDRIVTINTADDDGNKIDALVTTTTMKEQHEKSFYDTSNTLDCCLYPGEKLNMMFELINSSSAQKMFDIPEEEVETIDTKNIDFANCGDAKSYEEYDNNSENEYDE